MLQVFYLFTYCSMLNQIFNEDCLEWMKRIPDWSIDCIITDPPYWSTACRWDHVIPFDKMWEQLKRVIKPNGAIVLFWSEPFSSALRMSNIKNYRYDWIWDKVIWTDFLNANKKPLKWFEKICIFYKKQPTYNPQKTKWTPFIDKRDNVNKERELKEIYWTKPKPIIQVNNWDRHPRWFIQISSRDNKPFHPTQKPVALIEYLIKTYTNEWETVLDFTIGSGTTAIACINTNRNYIGFELDKWYFDIANERIAWKLQNKK